MGVGPRNRFLPVRPADRPPSPSKLVSDRARSSAQLRATAPAIGCRSRNQKARAPDGQQKERPPQGAEAASSREEGTAQVSLGRRLTHLSDGASGKVTALDFGRTSGLGLDSRNRPMICRSCSGPSGWPRPRSRTRRRAAFLVTATRSRRQPSRGSGRRCSEVVLTSSEKRRRAVFLASCRSSLRTTATRAPFLASTRSTQRKTCDAAHRFFDASPRRAPPTRSRLKRVVQE